MVKEFMSSHTLKTYEDMRPISIFPCAQIIPYQPAHIEIYRREKEECCHDNGREIEMLTGILDQPPYPKANSGRDRKAENI